MPAVASTTRSSGSSSTSLSSVSPLATAPAVAAGADAAAAAVVGPARVVSVVGCCDGESPPVAFAVLGLALDAFRRLYLVSPIAGGTASTDFRFDGVFFLRHTSLPAAVSVTIHNVLLPFPVPAFAVPTGSMHGSVSGLYETRAFGSGEESVADGLSKSGEEGGVTNCKLYRIVPARAVAGVVAFCFADSSQSAGTDGGVAGAGGATMDGGVAGAGAGACIIDYIFFFL